MAKLFRRLFALVLVLCLLAATLVAYAAPEDTPPDGVEAQSDTAEPSYTPPDGAFTPDGSGEVLDHITDGTKEFYTFTTPKGNVFYLVIDHLREADNVYFLNAVTEQDLVALAGDTTLDGVSAIPPTPSEPPKQDTEPSPSPEPSPPSVEDEKPPITDNSTLIYAAAAVVIVGIVAYYVKIVKPKNKAAQSRDEDDEPYDEDDEDDYE